MKALISLSMICGLALFVTAFQPKPKTKVKPKAKVAETPMSKDGYRVKFDDTLKNFGDVRQGDPLNVYFFLTNTGNIPVVIQDYDRNGVTIVNFKKEPVAPGNGTFIKTSLNTTGKLGHFSKIITITTNGGKHKLYIKYKVIHQHSDSVKLSDKDYDVIFDKTFHNYGQVEEGTNVETIFTLTNIGRAPVQILDCRTEGGYGSPSYSKEPIMPGKSARIKSPFNTSGKIGLNYKKFTLVTNGGMHELFYKCEIIERKTQEQPVKLKAND